VYAVLSVGDLFRKVWHQNSRLSLQWILGCLGADTVCCMGCWLVSGSRRAVGVVAVSCLRNGCCSVAVPSGRDMSLLLYTSETRFSVCTCRRSLTDCSRLAIGGWRRGNVCVFLRRLFYCNYEYFILQRHVMTHLFINTIHCITAGFTHVLHDLLNKIHDIKTELKLKNIC